MSAQHRLPSSGSGSDAPHGPGPHLQPPSLQAGATEPASSLRIRPRFAALGLVGGVMVCLPLLQLLQYQAAEVEWAQTQRAALDPAANAVAAQRSLVAHADSAGAVLRGQGSFETERRARQAEADQHVQALSRSLSEGHWGPALDESRQLSQDWQQLAQQVSQRQISASQSDDSHRLRVEQVLQVMDMLVLALAPQGATGPTASALALPRVAGQWAALSDSSNAAARQAALLALQQQLAPLRAAQAQASTDATHAALASAMARADLRSRRWLASLQDPNAVQDASRAQERQAALQALFELQAAASRHSMRALDAELRAVHLQRAGTLAGLLALVGLGLWLLRSGAPRSVPAPTPGPEHGPPPPAPGRESAPVASHLLQRLQQRSAVQGDRPHRQPERDARPSLPPDF